ncbi:hybrid sensor histidine kinase/response regulator transcription factor [Flavilitoribacter nigricans]|uniref:histidine kinase n=1 Tax=Flavilitoribacter nigricans (strain ATCC 23147 / DSM 23189 / NBRC 102662 / NCIMB 1420 / SS-2) TaxID=1122177 RepID=A0A2D0N3C9_FLAN2|nr:hybrid sensor histidine kinase/response regulator transcription factor [Flavilitoribacter nigricans]PHN02900.1 hypothetical protein CRP01_29265 [Flavilitoribacter nigricans DSM 23189 = NBRC 102662]
MRINLTFSLLVFVATAAAQSFQGHLKIENITFPEGNQLAYARGMIQDSTGLLWFHSYPNLFTYDGQLLSRMSEQGLGLPYSDYLHFFGDETRSYFFLLKDSLLVYDPAAREVIHSNIKVNQPRFGEDGAMWGLHQDMTGKYTFSVLRASNGRLLEVISQIENAYWFYDATLTIGDRYFVKLRDRVEAFDSTGNVKTYTFPEGTDPVITHMVRDTENTIWVVYSPDKSKDQYGAYYLREGADEFVRLPAGERFPQEEKFGMLYAERDFIWHWGAPFHLSRRRISDGKMEDLTDEILRQSLHFPFYNSTQLNLHRDRSGAIWMVTRAGMVKITVEDDLFRQYALQETGLDCSGESCRIRGMTEDEAGNIYLSHLNGITVLNPKTGQLSALPLDLPAQAQKVHALTYARGSLFWNEYAIDLTTYQTTRLFSPTNYDFLTHGIDPEATHLWIAVNSFPPELYDFDLREKKLNKLRLAQPNWFRNINSEIRQIHYSPTTHSLFLSVWIGGLVELGLDGEVLNYYSSENMEQDQWAYNSMYGLYEDEEAQLWIGHGGASGLSKLDLSSRELTNLPYQQSSFSGSLNRVFQIFPERGNKLWLVTEKGTLCLDKSTGELTNFPMFPTLSEMAYHQLPGLAARDGSLYIGTPDERLNAFQPETLYRKAGFDQTYRVALTRLEIFNKQQDSLFVQQADLAALTEINLTHQDRYFKLSFFVPDFRNTQQNRYSYWLEGYDNTWTVPSQSNELQYENLPPGSYTLHIRGGLTPDYYASSECSINIFVARAWYKTGWAYLGYMLLAGSLFWGLFRYEMRRQYSEAEARRLQELDVFKSRLYTNITHEFRTPLTVIMGIADSIRGHTEEKKLIQRNSENLLRLINQLLDLSKLDSGMLQLDLVQTDIVNYLQYLTESFYSMAGDKEVRLTFYPEVKELVMDFDETKIQHIIYNLLSNAVKFTPEGGKVILHLRDLEIKGQAYLQIKVSDTGVGIAAENLPHIFDRFYQAPTRPASEENVSLPATLSGTEGTGIGLALTKELVELMGGEIAVESKTGTGTDFLILLPIRRDAGIRKKEPSAVATPKRRRSETVLPPASTRLVSALAQAEFNPDADRPTLLIIEDNRDVITYIQALLRQDYRIEIARNGRTGIDKALEIVPDIIISDVMMPEKNGYEVCETLKNDERTSHIPIILLTAKATKEDRIKGLRGGADAYLIKPFHKEELFVRLAKLVELRKTLQAHYAGNGIFSIVALPEKTLSLEDTFLRKLIAVVEQNLDNTDFTVDELCRAVHLSNMQVNRKLKALTGETPSGFIRAIRLEKSMQLLQTTDFNVSEIAYAVGFNDPSYFSKAFSDKFGFPPSVMHK